jgi:hypothetical protein
LRLAAAKTVILWAWLGAGANPATRSTRLVATAMIAAAAALRTEKVTRVIYRRI